MLLPPLYPRSFHLLLRYLSFFQSFGRDRGGKERLFFLLKGDQILKTHRTRAAVALSSRAPPKEEPLLVCTPSIPGNSSKGEELRSVNPKFTFPSITTVSSLYHLAFLSYLSFSNCHISVIRYSERVLRQSALRPTPKTPLSTL